MKCKIFNSTICSSLIFLLSCNMAERSLAPEEKEKIKEEIISTYMDHVEDLMNLDYEKMMKFYPEEHIIFGDGEYWGDLNTIDNIWQEFATGVKEMIYWDVHNHKIFIHNKNAASYLVEFVNWRVEGSGDTTKVNGSFSFGMQRYPDGWKAATQNVTHHYTAGPWIKKGSEDPDSPFRVMPLQIGIVVSDLEKSLAFYTSVLGMTKLYTFNSSPELATKVGLTENKGFDAVVLKLNNEPGAAEYKLVKIHDTKREPLSQSFMPGLRYVTIHVKNVDSWVEKLRSAKVKMLTPEPIVLPDGNRILNFLDPDGALVEIYGP